MYLPTNSMNGFFLGGGPFTIFSCIILGFFPKLYSGMALGGKFILVTQQSGRSWRHGTPKQGSSLSVWFLLYM